MVISVLTSTSFPIFTVFLFILGVLIFTNVSKYYTFLISSLPFSSVQFSHSVMSDSLRPHELQDARPPCPSSSPGVHSNSCPSSRVMPPSHLILCRPLLLLPPIPPSIRVFSSESTLRTRQPKYWSFSFSIIPSKEIPGQISLQSKGLSRGFSNTTIQKHQFFSAQPSSQSNSHIHT